MRKIMIEDKKNVSGNEMLASAAEYINEGIYGYLLETEEELEDTCAFGYAECQCSTCIINDEGWCSRFEILENGDEVPFF